VCPAQSTTYVLRSVAPTGTQERRVTISVGAQGAAPFEFTADAYQVAEGACTTLHWVALGVKAVYLNGEGVAGEASKTVCPQTTTIYTLRVVAEDNTSSTRSLTIAAGTGSSIPMRFWADQYTLSPGNCTNVYWSVEGVQAVYFGETGSEEGVTGVGSRRECPVGQASYTLEVTTTDGDSKSKEIVLQGEEPVLGTDEVIAQGSVRSVDRTPDINSGTPGAQPGWKIVVDAVDVLFEGDGNCCQTSLTMRIPQALVEQQASYGVTIDWPINTGQLVEFRAMCSDSECSLDAGPLMYLRLRSQ